MEQSLPGAAHSILKAGHRTSRRAFTDKATAVGVTVGGIMVFVALLLIFFYLLYVVKPIFDSAEVEPVTEVSYQQTQSKALMVGSDEQNEILYRVADSGLVEFFRAVDGKSLGEFKPTLPAGVTVTSAAVATAAEQKYALGLSDGSVLLVKVDFGVTYPDNVRLITPRLRYPEGQQPMAVTKDGSEVRDLSFGYASDKMTFSYRDNNGNWAITRMSGEENMLTEEVEWVSEHETIPDTPRQVTQQLMTPDQRQLLLHSGNRIFVYDIRYLDEISLMQVIEVTEPNTSITNISLLAGASSILVSFDDGRVAQYFQVASDKGRLYREIRDFNAGGQVAAIAPEFFRKSFVTITPEGELSLHYTTSERDLFDKTFDLKDTKIMGFSPRASALVVDAGEKLHLFRVENDHPEVSWSALWQKVWYEGYPEPQYVWQSTSGSDDFEAKLSLMPLVFGTMKAAFYAMLFAVPLAIAGAVYTAYFMSPKVRGFVKPTVEIMEALPTVILGFLAGLWLAPLVEENLPGMALLLILLPLTILATAVIWQVLPAAIKLKLPEEFKELFLVPILCLVGWAAFEFSLVLELWLFDGDTRQYITNELGITFDQRNALVVGIAMGFAVIPTIFSIAEDAVFSVPRHLSNGSLALGATPWQTLTRVVLLTASPGIFSAVMMGLGRAVGETMIVLMATGNTPIMEWSVFEGMRTLAANIAVEMPESAIGSTHYRVLFLAAFVLFVFTFCFNTLAEVVRQRLRERYSSL
ncbi:ABC transporter permease subunit [Shewanella submarina]|uniref:ABC transporter permease subunit n=1 Tax=Shewanella submarina TaxID=2016376 RepID=A0ABV7GAZ8_9GAMM|nr:ABC transporter permease subunit [Shewanella submarina]MCL1036764.1 ABC transporter permease subunit [Shewanella submarina]